MTPQELNQIKEKRVAIYDFDGTIAKLKIDWTDWHIGVREIIQRYDPQFNFQDKIHTYVNDYIRKFGKCLRDEIYNFNENYEIENYDGYKLNESLYRYLIEQSNNQDSILYTSNSYSIINMLLNELQLSKTFNQIITRNDVTFIKPNPEGLQKFLKKVNQPKDQIIFLGDSSSDESVAKSENINFIKIQIS